MKSHLHKRELAGATYHQSALALLWRFFSVDFRDWCCVDLKGAEVFVDKVEGCRTFEVANQYYRSVVGAIKCFVELSQA